MENALNILTLAACLWPLGLLIVAVIIWAAILIYKEDGTLSPARLLMIYRQQFVNILKLKK